MTRKSGKALGAYRQFAERFSLWRRDGSDRGVAQRMAGATFVLRVVNAAIALVSQVFLARIMGEHEFGIYAYAWTWVLLLGYAVGLGIPSAAQRFIPEYTARGHFDLLRGFLRHARILAAGSATIFALLGAGLILISGDFFETWYHAPLYLALACLPLFALVEVQDGIARSYNWIYIAIAPTFLIRPLMILAIIAVLWVAGIPASATLLMAVSLATVFVTALGQLFALDRRLGGTVESGPRRSDVRGWLNVSLPLFLIEGFYLLLTYADILILERFHPPGDVAIYFAATKIMALASFVSFAVANATAHRFAEYNTAGDRATLSAFVRDAVAWTFWPSLVMVAGLLVFGKFLLWLFGPQFTAGYSLLPLLAIGLLARAAVGPVERLLAMCGEQRITAWIYFWAFIANVVLNLLLIPRFGLAGAAASTSMALTGEAIALFLAARRRMNVHVLPWGGPETPPNQIPLAPMVEAEVLDVAAAIAHRTQWSTLAESAAEPNVFYAPELALAAFTHLHGGSETRILLAWRNEAEGRRLIGLWPARPVRRRFFWPLPLAIVPQAYAPLTPPLLAPGEERVATRALLVAARSMGVDYLIVPRLPEDGPAAGAMDAVLAEADLPSARFAVHQRAFWHNAHPASQPPRKHRREIARLRRRLADRGALATGLYRGAEAAAGLEIFLALEASGWKGRRGTALAKREAEARFIRAAMADLAHRDGALVQVISLDGRPVAAALAFVSGTRAFYFKTAYDEAFAAFSPGRLVTAELTAALAGDPGIESADSLADAGHPMIDHLWRDRLAISGRVIAFNPASAMAVRAIALGETFMALLRARIRRFLRRDRRH